MAEHYTKRTVSATAFCRKCKEMTTHNVQGGRLGACTKCLARLEAEAKKPKPAPLVGVQESLF